jgi:hypothetical protein
MAIGAKTIETRNWSTEYRGDLAIHAAMSKEAEMACYDEPFFDVLRGAGLLDHRPAFATLPRGAIVAVVRLRDVKSTRWQDSLTRGTFPPNEWKFGDFSDGRFMWLTDEIRRLQAPVPCRGAQKLWEVPADIERQVLGQMEVRV